MSNHFLYFGPYLVCKFENIKVCKNRNCSEFEYEVDSSWTYCPHCSIILHEMNSVINQDEIISGIGNRLVKPINNVQDFQYIKYIKKTNSHIYIPNSNSSINHIFYDSSQDKNIEFVPEFRFELTKAIPEFKLFYSSEIEYLSNIYKSNDVKVHFGLLTQIWD